MDDYTHLTRVWIHTPIYRASFKGTHFHISLINPEVVEFFADPDRTMTSGAIASEGLHAASAVSYNHYAGLSHSSIS